MVNMHISLILLFQNYFSFRFVGALVLVSLGQFRYVLRLFCNVNLVHDILGCLD